MFPLRSCSFISLSLSRAPAMRFKEAGAAALAMGSGMQEAAPNVLLLMADELDARLLDPGFEHFQKFVQLPHLNGLASRGVNFAATYTASPMCGPSRQAIATARAPHRTNAMLMHLGLVADVSNSTVLNAPVFDPRCESQAGLPAAFCSAVADQQRSTLQQGGFTGLVSELRARDYDVTWVGKLDVGGGLNEQQSGFESAQWSGFESSANTRLRTELLTSIEIELPAMQRREEALVVGDEVWANHSVADLDTLTRCLDQLDEKSAAMVPWFLACSFNLPHPPFRATEAMLKRVDLAYTRANLPVVATPPVPPFDRFMETCKNEGNNDNGLPVRTPESVAELRAVYFSMCAQLDDWIGDILNKLGWTGLEDNTLVVFATDHGDLALEHNQPLKMSMYEGSTRTALIFSGPGIYKPGRIVTDVTSSLDLSVTLIDMIAAGGDLGAVADSAGQVDGRSLRPYLVSATERNPARAVVSEFFSIFQQRPSYMVRVGDLKLITFPAVFQGQKALAPLLFNITADPQELVDLAKDLPRDVADLSNQLENYLGAPPSRISQQAASLAYTLWVLGFAHVKQQDVNSLLAKTYVGWTGSDEQMLKYYTWANRSASLDLYNLTGINYTLTHEQRQAVIVGLAEAMEL